MAGDSPSLIIEPLDREGQSSTTGGGTLRLEKLNHDHLLQWVGPRPRIGAVGVGNDSPACHHEALFFHRPKACVRALSLRSWVLLLSLTPTLLIGILLGSYFTLHRFSELEENLIERGSDIIEPLAIASE